MEAFDKRWITLGDFWEYFGTIHQKSSEGFGISKEDIKNSMKVLDRQEHFKAMISERAKLIAKVAGPSSNPSFTPNIFKRESSNNVATSKTEVRQSKKKTRGTQVNALENEPKDPITEIPVVVVEVKTRRSFNILLAMFKSAPDDTNRKQVDWINFVAAMAEVGFVASKAGGGSPVSFAADGSFQGAWKGRIVFHEPHYPISKISHIRLRAWGRRMSRWFGWTENTFELKEK